MTTLLNFILRNRFIVMVIGTLVVVAGIWSYQRLPVNAFPDVSPSLVQVFTETEGLAPEEIEKYVTYPVETVMNGLPGVNNIRSVSNFGLSVVNIYFDDGTDIYFARQLVNERLQEARERIPEGFGDPAMGPISTGMGLVLFYYLEDETGKYSLEELRSMQDWIVKFQLQTVPGVTEVLGIGGYEKQYHVVVDPFALQRYDVTIRDVIDIIRKNNLNVGALFIERNAEELVVRSVGLASGIEDLENIVVKTSDGTPVFLRQLASVEIGGAVRRGIQTRDGVTEVVAGQVVKLFGSNSSTVIRRVEEKMKEINDILPEGVSIVPYYEQKSLVEASVRTVRDALLQGMLLVALILVLFMGSLRPSIVVIAAIPFSVLFAMIGMYLFDISINLMSFGGLAIAIGMMVDATLVLVERIDSMLRRDGHRHSMFEIIGRTFRDVARPVIFAVSIIIVVFLPLFTLEGVEGKTFHPLAYTVALAMLGSLIFAVFFSPALSSIVMKAPRQRDAEAKPSLAGRFGAAVERGYEKLLRTMVGHRWLAFALLAVMLTVGAVTFPQLGSEFTPTLREGTIVLRLTMAPSISLKESKRVAMTVERRLMKVHEVRSVVTRIGRGEVGAHTDPINSAEMYILLRPEEEWRDAETQEEVQQVIREEIGHLPGVLASFTQPIQMTVDELLEGVRAELAIKLFGEDLEVLKQQASEIARVVSRIEGARDVQPDQISGMPQLLIRVDRASIARYGINVSDVQSVVHAAVG